MTRASPQQKEMTALGLLGLIPFVGGAAAVWGAQQPHADTIANGVTIYAAVIVAYLAGANAGGYLSPNQNREASLAAGQTLLLVAAFAALALPGFFTTSFGFAVRSLLAALMLGGVLALDLTAIRRGVLPAWYRKLRLALTGIAATMMILISVRYALWGLS